MQDSPPKLIHAGVEELLHPIKWTEVLNTPRLGGEGQTKDLKVSDKLPVRQDNTLEAELFAEK